MMTLSGVNYTVWQYYCEGTLMMVVIATETYR